MFKLISSFHRLRRPSLVMTALAVGVDPGEKPLPLVPRELDVVMAGAQ